MAFMDILPDPTRKILASGKQNDTTGNPGPGFVSVKLNSNMPMSASRTNGGRSVYRSLGTHTWEMDVTYNQLTRAEFEPVHAFLMSRQGLLLPFYIILPQYELPREATFATNVNSGTIPTFAAATTAGSTNFLITLGSTLGNPSPGDIFNVNDTNNSNHVKTYMVTRCETSTDNDLSPAPTAGQRRIHITPPLMHSVASSSQLIFKAPKFRVMAKSDVQEYSLGVNNLFQFNLSLEEALP
jgi:hypothetical protein